MSEEIEGLVSLGITTGQRKVVAGGRVDLDALACLYGGDSAAGGVQSVKSRGARVAGVALDGPRLLTEHRV